MQSLKIFSATKKQLLLWITLCILLPFQNCSQVNFLGIDSKSLELKSAGNGEGYGGKPDYYRLVPDFTCENIVSPVSSIHLAPNLATLVENNKMQCGSKHQDLDPALIDSSIYQGEIVGYQEGIFEGADRQPTSIPANLVEVWCRTSKDEKGIETITHYNRETGDAVTKIYYSKSVTVGGQILKQHQKSLDFVVYRGAKAKLVTVVDRKDFNLEVYRDQPAAELGLFKGHLEAMIENQKVMQETTCRLGGSVDPRVWPSLEIIDLNMSQLKFSNDTQSLAFVSQGNLFSSDLVGANLLQLGPPMKTGVTRFEFSPNSQSLVFWGDPNNLRVNELFSVKRDGSSIVQQLNSLLISEWQSINHDIRFSADGTQVFYADSAQTGASAYVGFYEWLRSVPLAGGPISLIGPNMTCADCSVYDFGISKSYSKIVQFVSPDILDVYDNGKPRIFVSGFDNSNLKRILLPWPDASWSIRITDKLFIPDSGNYFFIKAFNQYLDFMTFAISLSSYEIKTLPVNWALDSVDVNGQTALISNMKNSAAHKIFNLETGIGFDIPNMINTFYSKDGLSLIGTLLDSAGSTQVITVNLLTGTQKTMGLKNSTKSLFVVETNLNQFIFASWERNLLQIYKIEPDGLQQKSIFIPLSQMSPPEIKEILMTADQQKLVIKLSVSLEGKSTDQLHYIPFDRSQAPLVIDTPVFNGALIDKVFLLNDSKTVFYSGQQIKPNEVNAFKWTP